MSGIFGAAAFDGAPIGTELLGTMAAAMRRWGPDGVDSLASGSAGMGHALALETPEDDHSAMPRAVPDLDLLFTAEGRIDNRPEILAELGITAADAAGLADSDVILRAYLRWGDQCAPRLYGDWSLAAWHARDRRLVLARDQHGNTALFVHRDPATGRVAFASDPRALHAVGAPRRLNELRLAQGLVSWPGDQAAETIDLDITRLPPAHTAVVTVDGIRTHRYWFPEHAPELSMGSLGEYAEGLRAVLDRAVRDRCRSARPIAVTLSGGLDSGSVTALASRALHERGQGLTAYTNVPIVDVSQTVGAHRFGDERVLAGATARFTGVDEHVLLDAANVTPMHGIELALASLDQPTHAASNAFWIHDLLRTAAQRGAGTLLTGQGGNATISWTGMPRSSTFMGRARDKGVRGAIGYWMPLLVQRRRTSSVLAASGWTNAAISPAFADRIRLADRIGEAVGRDPTRLPVRFTPLAMRVAITQPGTGRIGDLWAQNSANSGLDVRDPTADARVIDYSYAVPDAVFRRTDGLDRMLIRTAMDGLLPDEVRLNGDRGRQSADIIARLRSAPGEVDAGLAEMAGGPAEEYLSLDRMRMAWSAAQESDDPISTHRAGSILLRGMMAGLWLTRTYG